MAVRPIIFRAKRKDNGDWVEGDFVSNKYILQGYRVERGFVVPYNTFEVIPETVGQYTGLTDKNGKKIFEGDIVHLTDVRYDNEWKAVVVFGNPYGEYSWGWNFLYIGEKPKVATDILLWAEMDDVEVYCEIIGNIYDNPELLKGE